MKVLVPNGFWTRQTDDGFTAGMIGHYSGAKHKFIVRFAHKARDGSAVDPIWLSVDQLLGRATIGLGDLSCRLEGETGQQPSSANEHIIDPDPITNLSSSFKLASGKSAKKRTNNSLSKLVGKRCKDDGSIHASTSVDAISAQVLCTSASEAGLSIRSDVADEMTLAATSTSAQHGSLIEDSQVDDVYPANESSEEDGANSMVGGDNEHASDLQQEAGVVMADKWSEQIPIHVDVSADEEWVATSAKTNGWAASPERGGVAEYRCTDKR